MKALSFREPPLEHFLEGVEVICAPWRRFRFLDDAVETVADVRKDHCEELVA